MGATSEYLTPVPRRSDGKREWPLDMKAQIVAETLTEGDRPWDGDHPPGVAFTYASGRSGKHAVDILKGFDGILQVDGYIGYNRVIEPIMFRHVAPNE